MASTLDVFLRNNTYETLVRDSYELLSGSNSHWDVEPGTAIEPGATGHWRVTAPSAPLTAKVKYLIGSTNPKGLASTVAIIEPRNSGHENTYEADVIGPYTIPRANGWPNNDTSSTLMLTLDPL
jgi:hypothetical protein